jgi:NADPH:quinone reductase-like Zn-dependent oxidoreductase
MKAAVRFRYGSVEVVELRDIDRPVPVDDQVLVRVRAASVNRADLDGLGPRPAFTRSFMGLRAPRNPRLGSDVAGVVEAIGPAVTRFRPGDEVFADLFTYGSGSFAEFVCAPEKAFLAIPAGMSFDVAATLPHSAILAIQGLRLRGGRRSVGPGDRVLIVGASGNVGPFAVQLAKHLGAEVTGVCRTEKMDFVRSLGADHVIDFTKVDYTTTGERYDWILDTASHQSILRNRRSLRPNGVYITLGGGAVRILQALVLGLLISRGGRSMGLLLWWKPFDAADIATLTGLIAAGKVTPVIDRRYRLSEVVEALRQVDEGRAKGKVIVTM